MSDAGAHLAGDSCPLPILDHARIVLGHGSGGKLTAELVQKCFLPAFNNPYPPGLTIRPCSRWGGHDGRSLPTRLSSHPFSFPAATSDGLAVNGTVNDLAMSGANPRYIAAAFILEEGLAVEDLRRVVDSMRAAAEEAGVLLVTGDTKVVNRGKGDQVFITTTGLGVIERPIAISRRPCTAGGQDHSERVGRRPRHGRHVVP